jgi:hypothetical protein
VNRAPVSPRRVGKGARRKGLMMTDDNIDASNMVMFRLEATELKVRVLVQTGSGSENGYDVLNSLKVIIFF